MKFDVLEKDTRTQIDPALTGKFLAYFFKGFEVRPFRFQVTEANAAATNIISMPRVLQILDGQKKAELAVHLNFFCSTKIRKTVRVDLGSHKNVELVQEVAFHISKIHMTARPKADQDKITGGQDITKEWADRSVHRAENGWDSRDQNLKNLSDSCNVEQMKLKDFLKNAYPTIFFERLYKLLATSLIDHSMLRFSNRMVEVEVTSDASGEFKPVKASQKASDAASDESKPKKASAATD